MTFNSTPGEEFGAQGQHPTREKLVRSAIELMREAAPDEVTSEMVLHHSGVSRGSLYYHFDDLADLIETALVRTFSEAVDSNILLLSNMLSHAATKADIYGAVEEFSRVTQAPENKDIRFARVHLLGLAHKNPRLTAKLAVEQGRLTAAYTRMIAEEQAKGWMNLDIDPHAGAVLIQAYSLGRIVDDVAAVRVDPEQWNDIIMKIVRNVFGLTAE